MKREFLNPIALENLRKSDREYQRKKRFENKDKKYQETVSFRKKNPEKRRAYAVVYKAIKSGRLNKDKCRDCDRKDTQAHHTDYSQPLKVIWLCPSHHKLEDLKLVGKS